MSKQSDAINEVLERSTVTYKNLEDKEDIRAVRYFILEVISNTLNIEVINPTYETRLMNTKIQELKKMKANAGRAIYKAEQATARTKKDLIIDLLDVYDVDILELVEIIDSRY